MSAALLRLKWVLLYFVSRAGLLLPRRHVSTRLAYAVAAVFADACFVLFRGPRRKITLNLERVVGDRKQAEAAARQAFRGYAKYIIDLFQLPALGPAAIRARTDFHAWDALEGVVAEGKGTIFVTLHFGQQETGAAVMAASGYKTNVIAKTLEWGPINQLIQGFRREMGMNIIPAENGRIATFRCLARNEVLGMLIDMVDDPADGIMVDFFGAPAEMSPAAAKIALRTGARLVPAAIARDPADARRFLPMIDAGLRFEPTGDEDADVAALTQAVARSFEGFVRRYPDQWFAFRPVWRDLTPQPPLRPTARGSTEGAVPVKNLEAGSYGLKTPSPPSLGKALLSNVRKPPSPSDGEGGWEVRFDDRLNHLALELANALFSRLPKGAAYAIAAWVGDAAFALRKGIRADVEDNMRHVLGAQASRAEVSAAAREVFRNVCRYYADLIRTPRTKPEQLLSQEMTVAGIEGLRAAMAGGRGAVVATAHFGNPEIAVQIGALMGLDVLVLSEPLNPPAFSDLVHRLRESQGVRYEEVGFKAIGRALAHLRRGGTLAITGDRDIQDSGAPLPFFGAVTGMPLGAAEMALRTGAVLQPAYCRRAGRRYEIVFEDQLEPVRTGDSKLDAVETAKLIIARMEAWIASDPGQWMVLERIWREPSAKRGVKGKPVLGATMNPLPLAPAPTRGEGNGQADGGNAGPLASSATKRSRSRTADDDAGPVASSPTKEKGNRTQSGNRKATRPRRAPSPESASGPAPEARGGGLETSDGQG